MVWKRYKIVYWNFWQFESSQVKDRLRFFALQAPREPVRPLLQDHLQKRLEDLMSAFLLVVCVMRLRSGDIARLT